MDVIDLTAELGHGMLRHPAPHLPPVEVVPVATHAEHKRSVQRVSFGTHTSTHIDAPSHSIEGGFSIDQIPVDTFCGPTLLLRLPDVSVDSPIDVSHLSPFESDIRQHRRLVIETGWAQAAWGTPDYFTEGPYLTRAAAKWMTNYSLVLLGIDFPNVDSAGDTRPGIPAPNHVILLGTNMVFVENLLNLYLITEPVFDLTALPLRLIGGDGCPCRAIARVDRGSQDHNS